MKTMNGFTSELLVKKAKRNWRTRCGAFLLAALASWCGNDAFSAVIISTGEGRGLQQGINFANTPFQADGAQSPSDGSAGPNAHTDYNWNGQNGNNLNILNNGTFNVSTVNSVATPPTYYGTRQLTSADDLAFTDGGGDVYFNQSMNWTSGRFTVAGGAVANIGVRNSAILDLGTHLNVGGTLNILAQNGDGTRTNFNNGGLLINGGSNSGTINIYGSELTLGGDAGLSGAGTIVIGPYGMLRVTANRTDQNIIGNYTPGADTGSRGKIVVTGASTFNGTLSNNIAFDGGGSARIAGNNAGILSQLTVLGGTNAVISDQNNLGVAGVVLAGNGALSRADNTPGGDLHITNNITVGGLNLGSTSGGLNSLTTTTIPWDTNADDKYDVARRFYVDGQLGSAFLNANMTINSTGYGTVVLTGNNSGYLGNYVINQGVLEVSDQNNLGHTYTNSYDYFVSIGNNSAAPGSRAAFRVVGDGGNSKSIQHKIDLQHADSFYEVFTNVTIQYQRDAAGNILYFDPSGNPVADATLGSPRQQGQTNIVTLRDADRFKTVQANQIVGNGSLNKAGDGILELVTQNDYKGDTLIWHGVLSISNGNQINNLRAAKLFIGGAPEKEADDFRPVFETHLGSATTGGTIRIDAQVVINQLNSVVRTTGLANETIFTNQVVSYALGTETMAKVPFEGVLNKDGAGTLTFDSTAIGNWGYNHTGDLNIKQGTVKFSKKVNLADGTITIGTDKNSYKDIEKFDANGKTIPYMAVLELEKGVGEVTIGNHIVLDAGNPGTSDDPSEGAYIKVGEDSTLTLNGTITEGITGAINGSNLNKTGLGTLVIGGGKANSYTGWNNIYEGTFKVTAANSFDSAKGVDLIGEGTVFDMSGAGVNMVLNGLRGGTDAGSSATLAAPEDWTRKVLIGDNTLTLNIINFKTGDGNRNEFRGNIVGTGTVAKQGNTTLAAGFLGFEGTFDIQGGTLETLTDTTLTGIKGKAGSFLDVGDKTLTINIGSSQQYNGTIISSYPVLPYSANADRPLIIKDGAGTLTASFYVDPILAGVGKIASYQGDLTIKQGNIKSTSDFYMAGGGNLTFCIGPDQLNPDQHLVLDVSEHRAVFLPGGPNGNQMSTVHVELGDDMSTGWTAPSGARTVAEIRGNDKSDYSALQASQTDSLYYTIALRDVTGKNRYDKYVDLDITGFGGVGDTHNTAAIGNYLDGARVTNLTNSPGLAEFIQELWSYGSNVTATPGQPSWSERLSNVRSLFQRLAPDTIANGMFMGLDQPWRVAFDRLNLDSQMVYVNPQGQPQQQYRGQVIANMRNLWFTPTVQSVTARSDGNAKRFGIDRPGYKLGFDKRVAQNTSVGFQLGYSSPKLHEGDDRIEASDFQFGLYGGSMVGNYIEMKGFIGFGHQNYKSSRNLSLSPININNLSAHGRYQGDTFNFSFEVSRPLFLGFSILRPSIGLDSEHAFRYSFTETGAWYASSFDRASLSRTRARFGLSLETTTLDRAIFTGRLGYSALLGGHDYATASGRIVGVNSPGFTVRSVAVGKSFFEAGVGTKIFLNPVKTLSLVANYDATVGDRWAEHQALAGFMYLY